MTADNASANDMMTTHLHQLVPSFGGQATRTCCFLHIVNLVAKLIIKEFDILDKHSNSTDGEAECLHQIAGDIEREDKVMLAEMGAGDPNDADNDDAEWTYDLDDMMPEEHTQVEQNIYPVRMVLVKVQFTHHYSWHLCKIDQTSSCANLRLK